MRRFWRSVPRRRLSRLLTILAVALSPAACGGGDEPSEPLPDAARRLALESPAFRDGATMPARFGCDGRDVSPPLRWSGVPRAARELALVVEDPDAERFLHWTLLAIPPATSGLREDRVPGGAVQTENGFGDRRWGGPCPPEGDAAHRYVFALYALDAPLRLDAGASADEVRGALAEHALARGTLTGRFAR